MKCRFATADLFEGAVPGGSFDFIFDRGCFHCFDRASDREAYARRVAELLEVDGLWLSIIGSTEGAPRDHGPPRRTARDVVLAIEPALELVELSSSIFDGTNHPTPALIWLCIARRRQVPAQPSTKRPD
jgi:hypothetical protein